MADDLPIFAVDGVDADATRQKHVVVIGGAGVFGSRLARSLDARGHRVTVASRSAKRGQALADQLGPTAAAAATDRDAPDLADRLAALSPDIVVDASGPFQAYDAAGADPVRVARAALAVGAHYLDLADAVGFPERIADLDAEAKAAGRVVLSGASTMPAITSAAADALVEGLADVAIVDSALVPGNRAPRGLSIMAAILAQVGRPLRVWRGGRWRTAFGWTECARVEAPGVGVRRASLIGAPDLTLFPKRYGARSVLFRAGLELRALHHGLRAAIPLGRLGLPLARIAPIARAAAALFERFGTASGGMVVSVGGRDAEGRAVLRQWSVSAHAGDGPTIPATPVLAVIDRIDDLAPGARPCLGEPDLVAIEREIAALDARCDRSETPAPRLFEAALGPERWAAAPSVVRRLHDLWDRELWRGEASVERGRGVGAALVAAVFRFPRAADAVPVEVDVRRVGETEIWTRSFAGRRFTSVLGPLGERRLSERFGPFTFTLRVDVDADGALTLEPVSGRLGPIPLPSWLTPLGVSYERAGPDGAFAFDVDIRLPGVGRVVRYRGRLAPAIDG